MLFMQWKDDNPLQQFQDISFFRQAGQELPNFGGKLFFKKWYVVTRVPNVLKKRQTCNDFFWYVRFSLNNV